jgi:hypothetical protein
VPDNMIDGGGTPCIFGGVVAQIIETNSATRTMPLQVGNGLGLCLGHFTRRAIVWAETVHGSD